MECLRCNRKLVYCTPCAAEMLHDEIVDAEIVEDMDLTDNVAAVVDACTCYRNLSFAPADHAGYCPIRQWSPDDQRLHCACPLGGHFKTCGKYQGEAL